MQYMACAASILPYAHAASSAVVHGAAEAELLLIKVLLGQPDEAR